MDRIILDIVAHNFACIIINFNRMKQISFLLAVLICFAGFAQTEQLPDTILVQGLNEVVVKGEKPQVKGQNGIMVVDLPGIVKDISVFATLIISSGSMIHMGTTWETWF